jgi:internalin A
LTQPLTEQRMTELLDQTHSQMQQIITEKHTETRQELKAHIDKGIESITDILKYQQRNFLRIYEREQQREMITCPNLFTIRQLAGRSGVIKKQEWQIQLYCQHPGNWHPVGEPYVIEEQREWFKKALPYLQKLLKVLSVVAPLAGAALAVTDVAGDRSDWARQQYDIFENEVKMMDGFLKSTEAVVELDQQAGEHVRDLPGRSALEPHEGAGLVLIRELMDQLAEMDKKAARPQWAGLTRCQTPEGDIFWLDQEHLQEYLSKRPPVPGPDEAV